MLFFKQARIPGQARIVSLLRNDGLWLLASRTGLKVFLFLYVLFAAKYLNPKGFSDFQTTISFLNILCQPSIVISLIVARRACQFRGESRLGNILQMQQRDRMPVLLLIGLVSLLIQGCWMLREDYFHSFDFHLLLNSYLIVVFFLLTNYHVGVLQALEKFREIAISYFICGGVTFLLSVLWVFGASGGWTVLLYAQSLGALLSYVYLKSETKKNFRNVAPVFRENTIHPAYYATLLVTLVVFFGVYNSDVLIAKRLLSDATLYIQVAFFGKISFIVSSTVAMVVFPKASKSVEVGESTREHFLKGMLWFLSITGAISLFIYFFSPLLESRIFNQLSFARTPLLACSLLGGIAQSLMFFQIHHSMSKLVRWPAIACLIFAAIYAGLMARSHAGSIDLATNVAIANVAGFLLLFLVSYAKRTR